MNEYFRNQWNTCREYLTQYHWENMFYGKATELQTFKTWRFCCWARFVCAALGWLVSLNRFDQLSKQLHAKRREIDALRGAVRTASTKMIDLYNEQEKKTKRSRRARKRCGTCSGGGVCLFPPKRRIWY